VARDGQVKGLNQGQFPVRIARFLSPSMANDSEIGNHLPFFRSAPQTPGALLCACASVCLRVLCASVPLTESQSLCVQAPCHHSRHHQRHQLLLLERRSASSSQISLIILPVSVHSVGTENVRRSRFSCNSTSRRCHVVREGGRSHSDCMKLPDCAPSPSPPAKSWCVLRQIRWSLCRATHLTVIVARDLFIGAGSATPHSGNAVGGCSRRTIATARAPVPRC
jgi:hypothetical protein